MPTSNQIPNLEKFKIIKSVILSIYQVACEPYVRVACFSLFLFLSVNTLYSQHNEVGSSFWSHRISMANDVPYGDDEQQRVDIYMQGSWIGEPRYFKQTVDKNPTLIYMHGGGWIQGEKETRIGFLMPYLERGWNVVNVEYRLGKNTAPQAVDDVLLVVKWVAENAEKFNIDVENLVLSGESAGGHLCLISGLLNSIPDSHPYYSGDSITIRAIVNWFGVADIAKAEEYLSNQKTNYVLDWVGDRGKIAEISNKYSPIYHVTKNAPAIITIHGDSDSVVPHDQAQLLHEALDNVEAKHLLLTLPGGKHMGFSEDQFQMIYKTMFSFLGEVMD